MNRIIKPLSNRFIAWLLVLLACACGQKTDQNVSYDKTIPTYAKPPATVPDKFLGKEKENDIKTLTSEEQEGKLSFFNGASCEKLELKGETIIVVELDSIEIEQLKERGGEDNFYTAADDFMWYDSMMSKKMDSLGIPVKYTDKDTIEIYSPDFNRTIVKDSTFSLYTYFRFDGKRIVRKSLFELMEE